MSALASAPVIPSFGQASSCELLATGYQALMEEARQIAINAADHIGRIYIEPIRHSSIP